MLDHFHEISFILLSYFWQQSGTHYIVYIWGVHISPLFCAYVFMSFSSLSFHLGWVELSHLLSFLGFHASQKDHGSCLSYFFTVRDLYLHGSSLSYVFHSPRSFHDKKRIGRIRNRVAWVLCTCVSSSSRRLLIWSYTLSYGSNFFRLRVHWLRELLLQLVFIRWCSMQRHFI